MCKPGGGFVKLGVRLVSNVYVNLSLFFRLNEKKKKKQKKRKPGGVGVGVGVGVGGGGSSKSLGHCPSCPSSTSYTPSASLVSVSYVWLCDTEAHGDVTHTMALDSNSELLPFVRDLRNARP